MSRNARMIWTVAGLILILVGIGLYLGIPGARGWAFAAGIPGVLAAAVGVLKGRDWSRIKSSRSLYYGTSSTILTLAVVAIVVLINVIAESDFHVRWDLTADKLYSLSEQTLSLLREIEDDVTVYAFVRDGDPNGRQIVDLVQEYVYRSDRIRLRKIDPNNEPGLARAYEVTQYNTIVVESGDRRRTVQPFDIFGFDPFGRGLEFRGEQALTRALLGVVRGSQGKVYFTTGHGERAIDADLSLLRTYLTGEGYEVESLNLAQTGAVPENAVVLVIAGPARDFDPPELEAVRTYIDGGGRLFFMLDPAPPSVPLSGVAGLLESWGITFRTDVVIDPERHYFIDVLSPIPTYERHAVTEDLIEGNLGMVLPRTRSLVVGEPERGLARAQAIFRTSASSWGETRLQGSQVSKDEEDAAGPLVVGAVVEDNRTRVIAVGTSAFAANDAVAFQGNVDFFVNGVNWLAGHEETLTIRPKMQQLRLVTLTGAQANVIFYSTVVFVPLVFLVVAGAVAWRRRHL